MLWKTPDQVHVFKTVVFHDKDGEEISACLIDFYKDFVDIFSEGKLYELPKNGNYDHKIELKLGIMSPFVPIYSLLELKLWVLYIYLDKMLVIGKIVRYTFPVVTSTLFILKADSTYHLYIDYYN
jgi:hypothetical protein